MSKKKKSYTQTVVLLDTHAILHRAYHALPDFSSNNGEPTGALYGLVTMLLRIIETFQPNHIAACYDLPEPTYRHQAFADYKGTRTKTDDALVAQIERSRDVLAAFGIPIYEAAGFEADDILGTIAHQLQTQPKTRVIIASGDMDTMQCVDGDRVVVFTLKKGIKDTVLYDEAAVMERFGFGSDLIPDYKGLRGDSSDNIPGVRGIGEKTATTLITSFGSLEAIYAAVKTDQAALIAAGIKPRILTLLETQEEEAYFSKMLATIRTDAPIEYTIPDRSWRESLAMEQIEELCSALSFRTIADRVRQLISGDNSQSTTTPVATVDTARTQAAAIALWLLESDTTNPTHADLVSYARSKGVATDLASIETLLQETLQAHGLWDLYQDIELPLQAVISHMQASGIGLDTDQFRALSQSLHQELENLAAAIYGEAECEFNLNSPKQLGEVLYDTLGLRPKNAKKTAGGQRSTKESELEKLREDHPIIPLILRYREVQKLVSTYVDPLPQLVHADGRIHPTFLQMGTTTGRLACKDPNLQNIPTRTKESKAIRRGFVPAAGFRLVSIDYSQIELRIAAILSEDAKLIDIFTRGEDVHTGVAVRVFGVHADEVTSEMRRQAKVINFGILYGMGVNALQQNLGPGTARAEAQQFLTAYFQTFTRLAEYLEEVREYARIHGHTVTLFNRRRHFPAITSSVPHLRAQAERMAINAPIQGTAADIMRIAMNRVYERVVQPYGSEQVRMLLQVHDELLLEVAESVHSSVVAAVVAEMESVLDGKETHGVPIVVDVASGVNWADLEPES